MPRSRWVDYRALKQAVHIERVLDHYRLLAALVPKGVEHVGACPIHKGTEPTNSK